MTEQERKELIAAMSFEMGMIGGYKPERWAEAAMKALELNHDVVRKQ